MFCEANLVTALRLPFVHGTYTMRVQLVRLQSCLLLVPMGHLRGATGTCASGISIDTTWPSV